LVSRCGVSSAVEATQPVRHEREERGVHRSREKLTGIGPCLETRFEFDVAATGPAGSGHLLGDFAAVRHARRESHFSRRLDTRCGSSIANTSLGEFADRVQAIINVPDRAHRAAA
jgi:hypothetical protein